jgi:hypothetical protein
MQPAIEPAANVDAEPEIEWVALTAHPNYDIQTTYPFLIRKQANGQIIPLRQHSAGYVQCHINGRLCLHHRIIAMQFIPNPHNLTNIDHINHIKTDNRIENIRWISPRDNQRNKTSSRSIQYTYDATLPDEAIVVEDYKGYTFTDYYYHEGQYWFYTGHAYRRLHINIARDGSLRVYMIDDNGITRNVSVAAYQRHIGEIV